MTTLTRSQHPDMRLFTQVPGKLAWYSNRSYKTLRGADTYLAFTVRKGDRRVGITYSVITDRFGEYRVLATPIKKEVSK
jgi:hypothetical protein